MSPEWGKIKKEELGCWLSYALTTYLVTWHSKVEELGSRASTPWALGCFGSFSLLITQKTWRTSCHPAQDMVVPNILLLFDSQYDGFNWLQNSYRTH